MSSSRRVSPLDQRPRRRRRLEAPDTWETALDHAQVTPTSASTNATSRTEPVLHQFPFIRANGIRLPRILLDDFPSSSSSSSSSSSASTHIVGAHTNQDGAPLIPLESILVRGSAVTSHAVANADQQSSMLDSSSSDDSEYDQPQQRTVTFTGSRSPPTVTTRASTRGRLSTNVLQERNRIRVRHRRVAASPIEAAPPALLLYQIMGADHSSLNDQQPLNTLGSAKYLPLVQESRDSPERSTSITNASRDYTVHPVHKAYIESGYTGTYTARWLPGELPVELFDAITQYLSRDDIKSMRLVNKEFDRGVSRSLFDTVVVPFNTELYDMIEQDKVVKRDYKGKGRADDPNNTFVDLKPGSLQWQNAMDDKEDKVYRGHGLRVFRGFGSHIRRFGMSFEVKESALEKPPQKEALHQLESYFGSYDWPTVEYTRFEKLAGLERTADETSQMKLAFSHLDKVRHLALCLDSGLGWMNGPDKSMRSQMLQRDPPIFGGCSHGVVDSQCQERDRLWSYLYQAYQAQGRLHELKEGRLRRSQPPVALPNIRALTDTRWCDTAAWSNIDVGLLDRTAQKAEYATDRSQRPTSGVLFVQSDEPEAFDIGPVIDSTNTQGHTPYAPHEEPSRPRGVAKFAFSPANLDSHQKEWLLEAEWAQRAFLMSYMLAVCDNSAVFNNITVLNLARISSGHVPLFYRDDFWNALPHLCDVTIGVIPDWRTVERDEAGFVETKDIEPSKAHDGAYKLLNDYIGSRCTIKKVHFKWAGGGEQAEGCLSRNSHILPAPITQLSNTVQSLADDGAMLRLPFVEHLSLSNCWISPPAIINFVRSLEKGALKEITLESVSLTAHPKNNVANNGNQNVLAANPGGIFNWAGPPFAFGPANLQAQGQIPIPMAAQQFANQFWLGPGPGQQQGPWAQGMLTQMHQMLIIHNIHQHQLHQMWLHQPVGMTMGQVAQTLGMFAAGGMPNMVFPGNQAVAGAFNNANPANQLPLLHPVAPVGNAILPAMAAGAQGGLGAHALPATSNQGWYDGHRDGSWVSVLDALSPGPRLEMYRPRDEYIDPAPVKRETPLVSVKLISCGYVQLQNPPFDQTMLEHHTGQRPSNTYFQRRRTLLSAHMLNSSDRYLGHVVQHMPEREQYALAFAWGLRMGWDDDMKAQEAEYDGYLAGGTGRVSGVITNNTPTGDAAEQPS